MRLDEPKRKVKVGNKRTYDEEGCHNQGSHSSLYAAADRSRETHAWRREISHTERSIGLGDVHTSDGPGARMAVEREEVGDRCFAGRETFEDILTEHATHDSAYGIELVSGGSGQRSAKI